MFCVISGATTKPVTQICVLFFQFPNLWHVHEPCFFLNQRLLRITLACGHWKIVCRTFRTFRVFGSKLSSHRAGYGASSYMSIFGGKNYVKPFLLISDNMWLTFLCTFVSHFYPIASKYGIFTYIYHTNQPNVGIYTIHGWHGYWIGKLYVFFCLFSQFTIRSRNFICSLEILVEKP